MEGTGYVTGNPNRVFFSNFWDLFPRCYMQMQEFFHSEEGKARKRCFSAVGLPGNFNTRNNTLLLFLVNIHKYEIKMNRSIRSIKTIKVLFENSCAA